MVKLYYKFCNYATAWISVSQPGFRRTCLGVKRAIKKWINKKFEMPRKMLKSRQIALQFLSGNSQHLNNLCTLPNEHLFCLVWFRSGPILMLYLVVLRMCSFLLFYRTASPVTTEWLRCYQIFLVCKRLYREGFLGIRKIILRIPPRKNFGKQWNVGRLSL